MSPEVEKKLNELQNQIDVLRQELKNAVRLQEDYSNQQVFDRDVVFRGNVYNRAGTKVIN